MAKEYVCREDVINDIGELFTICRETLPNECGHHFIVENELQSHLDYVRNLPAADVVEAQYCRFSLEAARRRESVYKCSACGNYLTVRSDTLNGGRGDMNYCPFCGRKVLHKGQDGGQEPPKEEASNV